MKPFFKHPGSKWRLASKLPAPKFNRIIEPFAGSAGYSVFHEPRVAILNETSQELIELWTWIRDHGSKVSHLPTEGLSLGTDLRTLNFPKPALDLMRRWQRVGKTTSWKVSKWGTDELRNLDGVSENGLWGKRVVARIIEQHEKIRHWQFLNSDYLKLPNIEATWYIDPPYQHWSLSIYDCEPINYRQLAEWCKSRRGQVIVSEGEGADWLPFETFAPSQYNGIKNRSTITHRNELIWTKG